MIIEEIMKTEVTVLFKEDSIADAIRLMAEKKIRHIPIVDLDQKLIGLVSDRDIKDAAPSIFRIDEHREDLLKPLETIMKTNILTGHPLDFVEEVAAVFYEHHISCLPVVKEKKLVGIVTETDLLHTLVELTGAHQPGSQIEVKVPHKTGILTDITAVISRRKGNILSILVYPDKTDENAKIIVVRVQTMNPTGIIEELKKAGHQVLWPNLPGVSS
ncbi:acetoin utilization AcuB family protein [Bacillus sp. T33-2]|uniref:acetoin utilization AcuB family protein n=1 Tax=Bacillus sp. T33-2 TaxID=2054168 RepID=UPI000C7825EF|nr:acetoin utilization AcuB family protein [Bacillus sp. T33-2]PLR98166.1 acetoin utilization protein AcuB [Bacillus sp. T33-2]